MTRERGDILDKDEGLRDLVRVLDEHIARGLGFTQREIGVLDAVLDALQDAGVMYIDVFDFDYTEMGNAMKERQGRR